jgi:hypothetical protein
VRTVVCVVVVVDVQRVAVVVARAEEAAVCGKSSH